VSCGLVLPLRLPAALVAVFCSTMGVQFVPDFDATKYKVKPIERAPWHTDADVLDDLVSTYQRQYQGTVIPRREQIRPTMAYPWKQAAEQSGGGPTRSTAYDSFGMPGWIAQLPNTKPKAEFKRAEFTWGDVQADSTTSRSSFVSHIGHQRAQPIYPQSQRGRVDDGVFVTRSTQSDAYQGSAPIKPRTPIRPKPNGVGLGGGTFVNSTTSRSSFVPHQTTPYVAAKKPNNTLDSLGGA